VCSVLFQVAVEVFAYLLAVEIPRTVQVFCVRERRGGGREEGGGATAVFQHESSSRGAEEGAKIYNRQIFFDFLNFYLDVFEVDLGHCWC